MNMLVTLFVTQKVRLKKIITPGILQKNLTYDFRNKNQNQDFRKISHLGF